MFQNIIFGVPFLITRNFIIFKKLRKMTIRLHVFFNFRFSSRKSQNQQQLAKTIDHFTIKFRSKNLTNFTKLNLLDTEKSMLPQHNQKAFWLYQFSSEYVSGYCQKKHLHCSNFKSSKTAFSKLFENKYLYIFVYLRKKIFVPET